MKNKITAALLAFFLGGFGIHQFYLGNSGKGVLYLLFCWTFIPALIAIVDFIILLTIEDNKFNSKYNQGVSFNQNVNTAEELEKLHKLKTQGVISENEFQQRKNKLL